MTTPQRKILPAAVANEASPPALPAALRTPAPAGRHSHGGPQELESWNPGPNAARRDAFERERQRCVARPAPRRPRAASRVRGPLSPRVRRFAARLLIELCFYPG